MNFSNELITWYCKNYRKLPWRDINNPYFIWVSEIILQQTQVKQGLDYYKRFIKCFPTIESLANAEEETILKLWEGLGYYSRARNMHFAAKQIVNNHSGIFPKTYSEIRNLKGIGDYTAAAIASFAYNLPYAVVDGNVYRVLSRLYEISTPIDTTKGKKEFAKLAQQLINTQNPADYNQAIMELGALICKPTQPQCNICPVLHLCKAKKNNTTDKYPQKSNIITKKNRYFYYLHLENNFGNVYIKQRQKQDIWKNLYELPLIESSKKLNIDELQNNEVFKSIVSEPYTIKKKNSYKKHLLTHQIINYQIIRINGKTKPPEYQCVERENLKNFPMHKIIFSYLKTILYL